MGFALACLLIPEASAGESRAFELAGLESFHFHAGRPVLSSQNGPSILSLRAASARTVAMIRLRRGLWKQAIQDLLIATVQNLRKLLRHPSQTEPELAFRLTQLLDRLSGLIPSFSLAYLATLDSRFT